MEFDAPKFDAWLEARGLSDGTRRLYRTHASEAFRHRKGPLGRLLDKDLAPKTRHAIKAALRAYARCTKDHEALSDIDEVKLPPARRVAAKEPLETADWKRVVAAASKPVSDLPPEVAAIIGIMALRGPRVGDVLRMRSSEVREALKTGILAFEGKGGKRLKYRAPGIEAFLATLAKPTGWERVEDLVSPEAAPAQRRQAAYKRVSRWIAVLASKLGVKIPTHRLRRTYAVHYLRALKNDPEALEKLRQHMDWADMDTVVNYVDHVRGDELNAAQDLALADVLPKATRSR